MDDNIAIQQIKNGEIEGLELLVNKYQVKATRTAFLITHDESLAEDIVQDTFVRLFQHIRNFDNTRPFEPYLMRSVVNAALNLVRREDKNISFDDNPTLLETLIDKAGSVEWQVEFDQLSDEILQALSKISPRQRAVIVQRYYLGMSEKEMSKVLRIAPGTIKWLLNAARSRLRDLLS